MQHGKHNAAPHLYVLHSCSLAAAFRGEFFSIKACVATIVLWGQLVHELQASEAPANMSIS
jgi:hypothetical protein